MTHVEQHRVKPGQQNLILVDLVQETGVPIPGELVLIRATGATVRFTRAALPGVALYRKVWLRLSNARFGKPVDVVVSASTRRDDAHYSTYEFWFADPREAQDRVLPHLKAIFNERTAIRAKPTAAEPILATLESEPDGFKSSGKVADVSTHGLSLRIDASDETSFAGTWYAKVTFRLPGAKLPIHLPCTIRNRRSNGREVLIGVEFSNMRTEDHRRQQECIAGYVLHRQESRATKVSGAQVLAKRVPPAA